MPISFVLLSGCGGNAGPTTPPPALSPAGPTQLLYAATGSAPGSTATTVTAYRIGGDGSLASLGTALQIATFTVIGLPDVKGHHVFGLQGNFGSDAIVTFSVDPGTGTLTQVSSVASPANTQKVVQVAFNPSRTLMFVPVLTTQPGGTISTYSIDSQGNLALVHTVSLADAPVSVVLNPSGDFLYVATISGTDQTTTFTPFSIDATGTLTPVSSLHTALLGGTALAMASSGRTLYWGMPTPPQVVSFAVDAATGKLTQGATVSCSCVAADQGLGILINPKGTLLFQGILGQTASQSGLLPYAVDQGTGSLAPVDSAFLPLTSDGPLSFLFDSSGNFLYVTSFSRDQVFAFSLAAGGMATPLPGSPYLQRTNRGLLVVNFTP